MTLRCLILRPIVGPTRMPRGFSLATIICFINREVAARKNCLLAGSFFPFSKIMVWWLFKLWFLSFVTFSLNWHGTIAQSDASCLPFYNWVSSYIRLYLLDFFTLYPADFKLGASVPLPGCLISLSSLQWWP